MPPPISSAGRSKYGANTAGSDSSNIASRPVRLNVAVDKRRSSITIAYSAMLEVSPAPCPATSRRGSRNTSALIAVV